ncbi:MAG: oxygenase MpaB family protein [Gelidibacter sp.]
MDYFVDKNSIVREIWGNSDTILLVFAGASSEFALNKAVDWLYFTKKLPNDPLGRLFSTVTYARRIVFAEKQEAFQAIEMINSIHSGVEKKRGQSIPDLAYKDVLFMLIDYSIRSYEILERPLKPYEKQEVLNVFNEVGSRMHIKDLPKTYEAFEETRQTHLQQNLYNGDFTKDLYKQYRKHLGFVRYKLLIESQILIVPKTVNQLMNFRKFSLLKPLVFGYKLSRLVHIDTVVKALLLPSAYKKDILALNQT